MAFPTDVRVIDTMLDLPRQGSDWAKQFANVLRDPESLNKAFKHPAGFLFKDPVDTSRIVDPIGDTLAGMDRFNIEKALISVGDALSLTALQSHPDRFLGQVMVDPREGMEAVRLLERAVRDYGAIAASFFPCGVDVPIDDSIEDLVIRRESHDALARALAVLPERERSVIVGYFLEGRSSSAIAAELGVTESRVSQLRAHALATLRRVIESSAPQRGAGAASA